MEEREKARHRQKFGAKESQTENGVSNCPERQELEVT
jgi:hypothetical protein